MPDAIDILAFSPHPDDAEIGCGGLLLLSAKQGLRIAIVDLSEGEMSSRGTPLIRQREKALAAERLGLAQRRGLGLPDTQIGSAPEHEQAIIACLRELRPRVVLAPYAEDRHPDHVESSRLITRAVFFAAVAKVGSGEPHRIEQLLHYQIHRPFAPTLVVDVSSVWQEYCDTLAAYQSQFFPSPSGGKTASTLGDGNFLDVLEARGRHCGAMINATYGEPYFSTTPLYLGSALSLLRPPGVPSAYGSYR